MDSMNGMEDITSNFLTGSVVEAGAMKVPKCCIGSCAEPSANGGG